MTIDRTRPSGESPRIVILGAGPTGLAAGYRLRELGYTNFQLLEARDKVGGLASSERSPNGFTYDIGGHVLFSHYPYFDALFDRLMGDDFRELQRESWVWMFDRFLPCPFQNNIRFLPREVVLECLLGLIEAQKKSADTAACRTFEELIHAVFGEGIAKYFMIPYNLKVWAHPPSMLNREWIGERMSMVDVKRLLGNVVLDRTDISSGPDATFKYPRYGGMGELFDRMRPFVEDRLRLQTEAQCIDVDRKEVALSDGRVEPFDLLLSTIPMDRLVLGLRGDVPDSVREKAASLRHSGSFIVGIGIRQPSPSSKCWIHFPEDNCPFHRLTYLSNYSPDVVPDPATHYSLLAEVSRSPFKPVDRATVVEETIRGLVDTRTISEEDRADIVDVHLIERDYTYPTPSMERDDVLAHVMPWLESRDIFSRGRFGAWRYEVGNVDHSVAQGVEWVNRIRTGDVADELTYQGKRGC